MKRFLALILGLMLNGWVFAADPPTSQPVAERELRPILSPEAKHEAAIKTINQFISHVKDSSTFDAAAKDAVVKGWEKHQHDEEPEGFLMAGLAIVSEPFKTGLTNVEEQQYTK